MFLGVPLVPFVMAVLPILLVAVVTGIVGVLIALVLSGVIFGVFREVSKRDDQYLLMIMAEIREKMMLRPQRLRKTAMIPPRALRKNKVDL